MNKVFLYKQAEQQIEDIWIWTFYNFGEHQAEYYTDGMFESIRSLETSSNKWRSLKRKEFKDVYFIKYQRHFIFFKQLTNQRLGVISVLHESCDIPRQLIKYLNSRS